MVAIAQFDIAQIGKAFRNEITPGNFLFRTREFERKDGSKGISLEITADNVIPFERRTRDDEAGGEGRFNAPSGGYAATPGVSPVRPGGGGRPPAEDELDDLPF